MFWPLPRPLRIKATPAFLRFAENTSTWNKLRFILGRRAILKEKVRRKTNNKQTQGSTCERRPPAEGCWSAPHRQHWPSQVQIGSQLPFQVSSYHPMFFRSIYLLFLEPVVVSLIGFDPFSLRSSNWLCGIGSTESLDRPSRSQEQVHRKKRHQNKRHVVTNVVRPPKNVYK